MRSGFFFFRLVLRARLTGIMWMTGLLLAGRPEIADAATRTWDGGGDSYWTNSLNWDGDTAPVAGDTLQFPPASARAPLNNFPTGTVFRAIVLTGTNYNITGNPVVLTGGISSQGPASSTNTIQLALTLGAAQAIENLTAATLALRGSINLNGYRFTVNVMDGTVRIASAITNSGNLRKRGNGTLELHGSATNTYSGGFAVQAGTLLLNKSASQGAIRGPLTNAGIVRLLRNDQILDTARVVLSTNGLLDLNGFSDTIGSLAMTGARVETGGATGILRLGGDLTVPVANTTSVVVGRLDLGLLPRVLSVADGPVQPALVIRASINGSGGIIKDGMGWMDLVGTNTGLGPLTVTQGTVRLFSSLALGEASAGVSVSNSALVLDNVAITNSPITLFDHARLEADGSATWQGPVILSGHATLAGASGSVLDVRGPISGTGNLDVATVGSVRFSGNSSNTYTGTTTVKSGTLELGKNMPNGAIPADLVIEAGTESRVVRWLNDDQVNNNAHVGLSAAGTMILAGRSEIIGSLSGNGQIDLGSGQLVTGGNSDTTTFDGSLTGAGGRLVKVGNGTFTLTGTNTYSGLTTANQGALVVNGAQTASPIEVNTFGILSGSGSVGHVTNSGILWPGSGTRILTTSNAIFGSSTAIFAVELRSLSLGGHSQIRARGMVSLTGSQLWPNIGYRPAEGDEFIIIDNDGTDTVVGQFKNLPQSGVLRVSGIGYRINYQAGDGNDVSLTVTNIALRQMGSASISGGNLDGRIDPNECNLLTVVLTNQATNAVTGITATLLPRTPGVAVTQPDTAFSDVPIQSLSTNRTPFQILTEAGFVCGTEIELDLVVTTDLNGIFTVKLRLPTGCGTGAGPCESCPERTLQGSIDGSEPTLVFRLNHASASVCGSSNACPGFSPADPLCQDTYVFENGESNACVTVTLVSSSPFSSAAYSNAFNPDAPCANLIGNLGTVASNRVPRSYSFNCRDRGRFLVTVQEVLAGVGGDYELSVSGGSCRPVLGIKPLGANQVLLDWSSAASGYCAEGTNVLPGPPGSAWPRLTSDPAVIDGRFRLTNNVSGSTLQFFRLREPR